MPRSEELKIIARIARALDELDLRARRRVIDLFVDQIEEEEGSEKAEDK